MQKNQSSKYPLISVIIPSYNKGKYIRSTIESIILQGYPNFEVIIQDGGSLDESVSIIKEYAKEYPDKIIWESKKDKGQMAAINRGFSKARGEIFTYINADDIYLNGAFEEVSSAYLKNQNSLWFAGRGIVIDSKGFENKTFVYQIFVKSFKNILLKFNKFPFLLISNYLMQPSVFITKKAYRQFGPFVGTRKFVMEYDLWLKLGKERMPIIIGNYLSGFRMSKGSITTTNFNNLLLEDLRMVKKYTGNPILVLIHKIINIARIVSIHLIQ